MALPLPRGFNRRVVDLVADQLYAPTEQAWANLLAENLGERNIVITVTTVIDARLHMMGRLDAEPQLASRLAAQAPQSDPAKRLILVTGHRRENFGEGFLNTCQALREISAMKDVQIIYPGHLNPNVQRPVRELLADCDTVSLIEPVDYLSFVYLLSRSTVILTDSSGVQEGGHRSASLCWGCATSPNALKRSRLASCAWSGPRRTVSLAPCVNPWRPPRAQ